MPPEFDPNLIKLLHQPQEHDAKSTNGQLTVIAGSDLFHGPALFALIIATHLVDMVFFTSPTHEFEHTAHSLKSRLGSFIWVPFEEVDAYIAKSDAVLIGPGLKRFHSEFQHPDHNTLDHIGEITQQITLDLTSKFPDKQWIIDAGSLQVIKAKDIPPNAIITPNSKEFQILFDTTLPDDLETKSQTLSSISQTYKCHIVSKGHPTIIASPDGQTTLSHGTNRGFSKGGTGDCLASLIASLACKNPSHLSATAAVFISKTAANDLSQSYGPFFNADDLAAQIPRTLAQLLK